MWPAAENGPTEPVLKRRLEQPTETKVDQAQRHGDTEQCGTGRQGDACRIARAAVGARFFEQIDAAVALAAAVQTIRLPREEFEERIPRVAQR